ncbi:MAG: hypothetical protein V7776_20940 [Halopseudomonas aestusnigri]
MSSPGVVGTIKLLPLNPTATPSEENSEGFSRCPSKINMLAMKKKKFIHANVVKKLAVKSVDNSPSNSSIFQVVVPSYVDTRTLPDGTTWADVESNTGMGSCNIQVFRDEDGAYSNIAGEHLHLNRETGRLKQADGSPPLIEVHENVRLPRLAISEVVSSEALLIINPDTLALPLSEPVNVGELLSCYDKQANRFKAALAFGLSSGVNFGSKSLILNSLNEGLRSHIDVEDPRNQRLLETVSAIVASAISGIFVGQIHTVVDTLIKGGISEIADPITYEMIDDNDEASQNHSDYVYKAFLGSFTVVYAGNRALQALARDLSWLAKVGADAFASLVAGGISGYLIRAMEDSSPDIFQPVAATDAEDDLNRCQTANNIWKVAKASYGENEKGKMLGGVSGSALALAIAALANKIPNDIAAASIGGGLGLTGFIAAWVKVPAIYNTCFPAQGNEQEVDQENIAIDIDDASESVEGNELARVDNTSEQGGLLTQNNRENTFEFDSGRVSSNSPDFNWLDQDYIAYGTAEKKEQLDDESKRPDSPAYIRRL